VTLALLVRPQGRRGELLAEILTDFPERFSERRRLFLRGPRAGKTPAAPREVRLEDHWLHKGRLVLKFAGIDSIEDAEVLRGLEVVIPHAERAPLEEGAVYIGDLVGCTLFDRSQAGELRVVGEIVDVDRELTNMELLVVRPGAPLQDRVRADAGAGTGAEILVPFAKAYQPHIDLEARRMEMTLPAGLLELDAPLTGEEREALAAENGAAGPAAQGKRK
jgi:16S rRNA processing protein RimM